MFAAVLTGCAKKNDRKMSLVEVDGTIGIERGKKTISAERGTELKSGDVIVTGERSGARIRIDDDKFLYLGASSNVLLTVNGTADNGKTIVFIQKGSVMTEVKRKLNAASSFDVVTPNTSMAIRGTKTLTEVYEDILGAIKTSAAVVEGQVSFKTVQKNKQGEVIVVPVNVGAKEGVAVNTPNERLVAAQEIRKYTESGRMDHSPVQEVAAYEDQNAELDKAEFSEEFLTNCVAVLAKSREEDIEEGFVAESVTEEELSAAINVLNDVIDGKILLPVSVEEYILSHSQPYYEGPIGDDIPAPETDPADQQRIRSRHRILSRWHRRMNKRGMFRIRATFTILSIMTEKRQPALRQDLNLTTPAQAAITQHIKRSRRLATILALGLSRLRRTLYMTEGILGRGTSARRPVSVRVAAKQKRRRLS